MQIWVCILQVHVMTDHCEVSGRILLYVMSSVESNKAIQFFNSISHFLFFLNTLTLLPFTFFTDETSYVVVTSKEKVIVNYGNGKPSHIISYFNVFKWEDNQFSRFFKKSM